ncbi:MSHA biogenesis protein MshO [Cellvibrio zantedeschiae]|uniref:MSHA biogenesis protein MshO n=1 Tax=Cellvibrio zantedeschiae TaxID=1237077 RepID=A0ABQ3AU45_9GAMM|nr:prepilin-type N-terminal cleavage/methylation domain-containing protein [Cellvibrio zantedeschiae]GGY67936.1 MSHA biogenesis protein MshO [Cellvibrio zantedeschiae]
MSLSYSKIKFSRGFTLIEVITVIVILSILAVLGTRFVLESTKAYQSTQTRSRLINTGRQAIERMSRQLRVALPYSVRLTNGNTCLEFMPIASGGNYADYVPDLVNGATATQALNVSPHVIDFGTAVYVSIGAMAPDELYGTSPTSRATLTSRSANQLNFSPARGWTRNSVNKRFYLLDRPQAFCVVNGQLRFYADQDANATDINAAVNTASAFSILADNVTGSTTPFALTAGSENRNTVVRFNITFMQGTSIAEGAESIVINHSVMIRNVP